MDKSLERTIDESIKLESGDAVVLFTDGITEAMNTNGEEFSDERLEELSVKYFRESAEKILANIKKNVEEYTRGAEQSDDITSVIIKAL